ncbi:hypothetical protein GCM10009834_21730 [Streptomonospora arabica]
MLIEVRLLGDESVVGVHIVHHIAGLASAFCSVGAAGAVALVTAGGGPPPVRGSRRALRREPGGADAAAQRRRSEPGRPTGAAAPGTEVAARAAAGRLWPLPDLGGPDAVLYAAPGGPPRPASGAGGLPGALARAQAHPAAGGLVEGPRQQ